MDKFKYFLRILLYFLTALFSVLATEIRFKNTSSGMLLLKRNEDKDSMDSGNQPPYLIGKSDK